MKGFAIQESRFFSSSVDQRMRAFGRVVCKLILEGRDKFEYSKTWSSDY